MQTSSYIPSLDGIRAISVLLVLVGHAGLGHIVPGGLGVTIFFFLSGFLITTLLLKEYDVSQSINIKYFYYRRFFRLFPPLIACLLLVYSLSFFDLIIGEGSLKGFLYQLFYLANYHKIFHWEGDVPKGLGVLWSLAVEEHFYIFFPFILLGLLKKYDRKVITWVFVAICLVVLSWRFYLILVEHVSIKRTYYGTDTRIDSILIGSIFALSFNPLNKNHKDGWSARGILLLVGSTLLIMLTLLIRAEEFRQTIRYSLQGIALMPIFYYAVAKPNSLVFKILNVGWMRKLGVYSYSVYLIHFVVASNFKTKLNFNNPVTLITVTLFFSILFACFVDVYVERYFRKLRKKFH